MDQDISDIENDSLMSVRLTEPGGSPFLKENLLQCQAAVRTQLVTKIAPLALSLPSLT